MACPILLSGLDNVGSDNTVFRDDLVIKFIAKLVRLFRSNKGNKLPEESIRSREPSGLEECDPFIMELINKEIGKQIRVLKYYNR